MKVSGIIHQQICQLKWHLLACLGLIMVLPVEEAIINLKEGDGFFTTAMTSLAVMFSPLLTGLIACANVQGDLNEKRYIFWRSKPADVRWLISMKFFIGLVASLLIIVCPVLFSLITNIIWNGEGIDRFMPLPILISIMTYSLCFACNVVVRKTARAWLIGMLTGCFLLVLPFMLPLNLKDFVSDIMFLKFGFYLAIILVASAAAFVFALFAAKHDWHLRTNLKGLLWAVAWLTFVLLMLFSSQVANIKVLQEKKFDLSSDRQILDYAGNRIIYKGKSYIDTSKKSISLRKIKSSNVNTEPNNKFIPRPMPRDYHARTYPQHGRLYQNVGNNVYSFNIYAHCRNERQGSSWITFYEKIFLRSYKDTDKSWMPVCEIDISDCLKTHKGIPRMAMRLIDNRLIVCVNDSCILVDATDPEELKLIDKKIDVLKRYLPFTYKNHKEEFSIPLVPIVEIGMEERIRLSIDLNYGFYDLDNKIYESSIVDFHDDKFAFFFVDYDDIARFDVTRWDDEKVYCKFSSSRPFTILESITASYRFHYDNLVKNGNLYSYGINTLMVFDIRSNRRIRKLGHFVRMDYEIDDMAILEDGNILLCVRWNPEFLTRSDEQKNYLYLLKNPE